MKKDDLCKSAISLENEIEFLKEVGKPTKTKKTELNKIYAKLKKMSERKVVIRDFGDSFESKEENGL